VLHLFMLVKNLLKIYFQSFPTVSISQSVYDKPESQLPLLNNLYAYFTIDIDMTLFFSTHLIVEAGEGLATAENVNMFLLPKDSWLHSMSFAKDKNKLLRALYRAGKKADHVRSSLSPSVLLSLYTPHVTTFLCNEQVEEQEEDL
jgi:hypothetical protein